MTFVSEKLQIYRPVAADESIVREEWHTYHPFTNSYNYSDEIEIVINQLDIFMDTSQAELCIEASIVEEKTTGQTGSCTLTNNAGAFLFESVTYELNGKEIEKVRDPGLTSTIKNLLCLNEQESNSLNTAGWSWPSGTMSTFVKKAGTGNDGDFNLLIPLHYLFGIFSDYKNVIMGKQKIKLVRARNDENCYINATGNKKAAIVISSIELRVKHIYLNDAIKLKLFDEIGKNKAIFMPFRSWEIHELPALRKTKKDIWTVKSMSERARYVIVFFHEDRKDNLSKDCTYFDNLNIIDVKLFLNSETYPYEPMNLNFNNCQYAEIYRMYTEFQKSYLGKVYSEPLLNFTKFASRALFVIDCSKQNEALKSSTTDVKIEFQSSNTFSDNTRAYCIIVHDRVLEHMPLTGNVRTLM